MSFLDYYTYWLKSVDRYSDEDAQVILVGTHAENLSEDVSLIHISFKIVQYKLHTYLKKKCFEYLLYTVNTLQYIPLNQILFDLLTFKSEE